MFGWASRGGRMAQPVWEDSGDVLARNLRKTNWTVDLAAHFAKILQIGSSNEQNRVRGVPVPISHRGGCCARDHVIWDTDKGAHLVTR